MGAFLRRVARAMVRRAGEGELDAVVVLLRARADIDEQLGNAARAAHDFGYSWTDIARELGMTRQNALKRWARNDDEESNA